TVTLLPPQVPHDGRSATPDVPFRKRVLYLEPEWLPHKAVDAAAEAPTLFDPIVTSAVDQIHAALNDPADVLAAECGVLALRDLVQPHLKSPIDTASDKPLARRLRHLLDDRLEETFTIAEAAAQSGFHDQSHLTRHFRRTLGTTPGVFAA
ncbi:AraC family transcriptional regulator, partial [Brevibacterium aurantiacum]|uniref:AraC family transcriptional regulator n=1 Tax=Brevibacterium aurantiacum TaxID=273384 RepID=UPI003F92CA29